VLGFGDNKMPFLHVFHALFLAGPLFDALVCCCCIVISVAFFLCSASLDLCVAIDSLRSSGSPFSQSWCELTDLSDYHIRVVDTADMHQYNHNAYAFAMYLHIQNLCRSMHVQQNNSHILTTCQTIKMPSIFIFGS
jgi:hypothetical protein